MIVFKKIKFKNFISTGNAPNEIVFDEHERTLVTSDNGTGKSSSCIDSIVFALYGKAHRNIRKDQLINSTNGSNLFVEVWFRIGDDEYKVERGLKPNIFEIYVNDIKQNNLSNIKDMQAFLENDILKMNYTAFANVAILSSSEYVPFMQQPIATRRLLVEELLDINIFGAMLVVLKERIKTVTHEIKDINYQIVSLNKQIDIQKKLINSIKDSYNNSYTNNQEKIKTYEYEIVKILTSIEEHNTQIKDLEAQAEKFNKVDELYNRTNLDINLHKQTLKEYQKTLKFYTEHQNCPTCEQQLDNKNRESKIITCNKNISELSENIKINTEKHQKCLTALKKLATIRNEIIELERYARNKQSEISIRKSKIQDCKTPIVVDDDKLNSEVENLKILETSITQYRTDFLVAERDLNNYQMIAHMLSDSGIKSKIIDKYLPIFNNYINNYLEQFGVYINFIFDNTFKESIKSRYRDLFSYTSFSEGEKIKISLAIMLSFRDLAKLKNSVNTNLLIMDEIFDSSLDFESNKNLMNILKTMRDTNIIIISHRNDIKEDDFDRVLHFRKEQNFSLIETAIT